MPKKSYLFNSVWPAAVLLGLAYSVLSAAAVEEPKVPYDLEKFRPVLDASKLQAPTSSPAMIEHGKFAGQSNEYFYLDETGRYMVFTVSGASKRSELRQLSGDWDTATTTARRLVARVKVFAPETDGLEQFTFLQIHDTTNGSGSLNKPLIRITRRGEYRNTTDHLWAAIRTPGDPDRPISSDNLATLNVDLGPRPEGFFDIELKVLDSRMTVTIAGKTKVDMDVSYWDGLNNYFKAGVYNQDEGTSVVHFDQLAFIEGSRTPASDNEEQE